MNTEANGELHFLTQRLWNAHNLLLNGDRVVLIDYDHVRWRGRWGQIYYAICWLLFVRDYLHLAWRQRWMGVRDTVAVDGRLHLYAAGIH